VSEPTPCQRLADALHACCVALEAARADHTQPGQEPPGPPAWLDRCGHHVTLALAAVPDSVLRAWLMQERTVGGDQIYRTIRAGAGARCNAAGQGREAYPAPACSALNGGGQ